MSKPGLYANIHAKRQRIKDGSGEEMRKVGDEGAPTKKDFVESAKTAKAMYGGEMKKNMKKGGPANNKGLKALVAAGQGDVVESMGFDLQNLGHGGNVCSNRKKMMYGGAAKKYTGEDMRYGGGVPYPRMPDSDD
jgi:hypothetical protein